MKTGTHALLAAAATAITVAACSGSGTTSTATTPADVAVQIGATNVQPIDPTLYASKEADATWHGQTVDIATFQSQELRDKWIQAASQFGPILAKGQWWAVTTG